MPGRLTHMATAVTYSTNPGGPLEVPDLVLEPCHSRTSTIDALVASPSVNALVLSRIPSAVPIHRPLEMIISALGTHPGNSAAASLAHCISSRIYLTVTVQLRNKSRVAFSVPAAVRPARDSWVARALKHPMYWADAESITITSCTLAGRPLLGDLLPATIQVGFNHASARAGAVHAAAKSGDVSALQAALTAGGSTEEADVVRTLLRVYHLYVGVIARCSKCLAFFSSCPRIAGLDFGGLRLLATQKLCARYWLLMPTLPRLTR